ncbi:enterobactin synthetase component F (plasmid) [Azospirillum sp. B510]|uniref:non-ribosomal peptide synthetase n=1 Tax=Azospirillum sp. (strain B510) TaxID=137722 RepID=UPI0001C4BACB|nr:non-ribosomal peptide synthetase [Azospirillum sp. B510]BAI74309.1 enterobactin synthetase component F [Azospirillum sp. B510]
MTTTVDTHAIAERLHRLPAEKRARFRIQLAERGIDSWSLPIVPFAGDGLDGDRADSGPLSAGQTRLWVIDRVESVGQPAGSALYSLATRIEIAGFLDIAALGRALNAVVRRHEVLRTVYGDDDGSPVQRVLPSWPDPLTLEEAAAHPEELIRTLCDRPFDLERELPLRAHLVPAGDSLWQLLLVVHHIAFDAWSEAVLIRDLGRFYDHHANGAPLAAPLAAPPVTKPADHPRLGHRDFARWQRDWLDGTDCARQIAFWRDHLADAPDGLSLPLDHPRPARRTHEGAEVEAGLPPTLIAGLNALAARHGATLYAVARAAFVLLLGRYGDTDDLVLGTTVANRQKAELADQIGFFANTLPIRHRFDWADSFSAFLDTATAAQVEAFDNQDLPFDRLLDALEVRRGGPLSPLFQVLFVHQNVPRETLRLSELELRPLPLAKRRARFDLTLRLHSADRNARVALEYSSELFDAATARRLLDDYLFLLEQVAAEDGRPLSAYRLRHDGPTLRGAVPTPAAGADALTAFSVQDGARTALRTTGASLTYAELSARADRLAAVLRRQPGGTAAGRVGILLPRGIDQPTAMIAAWKAGACWVPLDGALPADRLRWIAGDAALTAILGQGNAPDWLPEEVAWIDVAAAVSAPIGRDEPPPAPPSPDAPAYVIYTSGSTGRPKGVEVPHRALVAYATGAAASFGWAPDATLVALSSVAADLGFTSLWGALLTGRTLRLLDDAECGDPEALAQALDRVPADVLKIVPSHLAALLALPDARRLLPRRALVLGGEAAPAGLLDRLAALAPEMELWNHYGPTETTVGVAIHRLVPGQGMGQEGRQETHLTRPLPGCTLHVLDRWLRPVPVGASGDLWIGGPQLALGYVGAPALTAERFVVAADGQRLYRSGDRVRLLPAGATGETGGIAFLGRADGQVKINGFRVEPGEIESQARALDGIVQAVALAIAGPAGNRIALAVAGWRAGPEALRRRLAESLPPYMLPRDILTLDSLPLLPNGKIDRRSLTARMTEAADRDTGAAAPASPTAALADRIGKLFATVLARAVGTDDNFFGAGGDSILGLRLAALARTEGLAITPRMLFEHQTPAALASALGGDAEPAHPVEPPAAAAVLALFRETLRQPDLTADTDFFGAGGDSILCLQLAAKARRSGLAITPKLIFAHPTAAALAAALPGTAGASATESASDDGPIPLRPIQRWFLAQEQPRPGHWNQSILLELWEPPAPESLRAALDWLVRRHPALCCAFTRDETGVWTQRRRDPRPLPLRQAGPVRDAAALAALLPGLQPDFDLAEPPLLDAVLIEGRPDGGTGEPPAHLLLSAHHLVVDGVSWRVLAEDLWTAYRAHRDDGRLPDADGTTHRAALAAFRASAAAAEDLLDRARAFWSGQSGAMVAAAAAFLSRAGTGATPSLLNRYSAERHDRLDAAATDRLGPNPRDALLAALCDTLAEWTGQPDLAIELEAHGRDGLEGDAATAVGWFTSRYPLLVRWKAGLSADAGRAAIAAQIAAVPDGGRGFGLLRDRDGGLSGLPIPPVVFNHHGRLAGGTDAPLRRSPLPVPNQRHPDNRRIHLLELDTVIEEGGLRLRWVWPRAATALAELPERFLAHLNAHLNAHLGSPPDARPDQPDSGGAADRMPLSPVQAGMLFHALTDGGRGRYLNQVVVRLDGPLDADAFRAGWQATVDHHPALRAAFDWPRDGEPHQDIAARAEVPWRLLDWSGRADAGNAVRREADRDLAAGMDLTRPPLMRLTLLRLSTDSHALIWTRHHLIADGWCTARLIGEVAERYRSALAGHPTAIDSPPPYRRFIDWLGRRDAEAGRSYWAAQLGDLTDAALLPRATVAGDGSHHREMSLDAGRFARLRRRAAAANVTVNTLCQVAAALALARHTGRDDVVLGIVGAGRPADLPDADRMIGLFITTTPLRVRIDRNEPLDALLRRVQRRMSENREHEHTPLSDIQAAAPLRDALFDTLLVFENYPLPPGTGDGPLKVTLERTIERTNYPLTLVLIPRDTLTLRLTADRAVLADAIADSVGDMLMLLLDRMAADDGAATDGAGLDGLLSLLPADDLSRQRGWNATAVEYGGFVPLGRLLSEQAARSPDAVALQWEEAGHGANPGDRLTARLTYADLDRRANRLAHWLIAAGCRPDDRVALCLERSPELVVAILAALKAGCAWLPLDPEHPPQRLAAMVADGGARLILAHQRTRDRLPPDLPPDGCGVPVHPLDPAVSLAAGFPDRLPDRPVDPAQLAYALFTSGSTGRPKAVGVPQAGLLNRLRWMQDRYRLSPADTVLQKTPYGFDVSVWEFLWPLLTGARLVLAGPGEHRDARRLSELIEGHGVTTLHFVPAMLQVFLDALPDGRCPTLARVLCSGEALPAALRDRCTAALPQAELHNLYGPTEASIDVTAWDCRSETGPSVPIGHPIANIRAWVLDDALNPVPAGVAGELYLTGVGLARGYLGRPDLTAAAFLPNPLYDPAGDGPDQQRLYRTGDLARHRPDGAIDYLGRADFQVKIRGQRVELGEIEAALAALPQVAEAVVAACGDKRADGQAGGALWLTAWLTARPGQSLPDPDALRAALADRLPDHMVPAVFVPLDRMPINQNGKIDRKALPQPEPPQCGGEAPDGPVETALAALWSDLLGHPVVSRDAHFFLAGGHSLLVPRLVGRVQERLGRVIDLVAVMEHPVLRDLAAHIAAQPATQPATRPEAVPPAASRNDNAPAGASYERFEL